MDLNKIFIFFYFSGVYGGNYGSNYRLNRFKGEGFETVSSKLIKSLTNMQCVLHDGKGGTCPLAEDLIITYTGKKTRRDGSLKRYVTYYITSHPELKWLTEIALVEYIGYGNMGWQES